MSDDYMTTRKGFLLAAASYLGIPEGQLMEPSSIKDDKAGTITVCLAVALTPRDMIGISKRMEAIAQASNCIVTAGEEEPEPMPEPVFAEGPDTQECRARYNRMTKEEKASYGSFGRYVADQAQKQAHEDMLRNAAASNVEGRQVVHIDTPEEAESTNMDAVWLHVDECSQAQVNHAVDWDRDDRHCLVSWAMLTDEQK